MQVILILYCKRDKRWASPTGVLASQVERCRISLLSLSTYIMCRRSTCLFFADLQGLGQDFKQFGEQFHSVFNHSEKSADCSICS